MLLLLLLASVTSAEFLAPVLGHDDATLPDLCQQDTVMSCNLVQVDIASLYNATLDFLGTTLNFLDQPAKNTFTFSSEDGDEAIFTVDIELAVVWGHAQLADGRDFIIEPNLDSCKGCHVVIEENEEAFPEDHAVVFPEDAETRSNLEWTRTASDLLEMGKTDRTTVVTYSIKLYYTPEVRESVPDIRAMADQVIATTNQGYINSEIPLRATLHCLEETEKPESWFLAIDDVNAITLFRDYKGGDNGLRGSADAAALIVKEAVAVCGIAALLPDGANYGRGMVSMTDLSCALGGYTFGHELGHNMGLDHDKYENGGRVSPYSQGYHLPGTKYRTILAYNRISQEGSRQRINHYSNPDVKFQDVPTGSDEADSARRMTDVRFVIAAIGDETETCTTNTNTATTTKPPLGEHVISSPNFPGNYPNDFNHTETIQVDAGQVIRFEFTDFDVEFEDTCRYDFLTISETSENGETTILPVWPWEKGCGTSLPPVMVSTTNKVNILFKTDGSVTKKGWSIKWTAVTLDEGVISSPNFTGVHHTGTYPNDFTNTDTIEVDKGKVIRLEFKAFDVEDGPNCEYDSLTITQTKPNGKTKTLMAKRCGDTMPSVVVSTTNKVNLIFETDPSVTKTGWYVEWTAMTPNA